MRCDPASYGSGRRFAGLALVALGASTLGMGGCAGDRFTSGGSGGSSGSGNGGTGGTGGSDPGTGGDAMGSGGSANAAGLAGASGAGGSVAGSGAASSGAAGAGSGVGGAATCSCPAGQYCRSGTCYLCSDLGQLDVGPAEEILDDDASGLRFPRLGDVAGSLFFTRVRSTGNELWYLPLLGGSAPVSLGSVDTPSRAGLDYFGDDGALGFDLFFDELGVDGHRSIHAASWQTSVLADVNDAPSPLSAGGFDDFSVALARTPKRAYWMTTRDGTPTLRTGMIGSGEAVVVDLKIPAQSGGGVTCSRQGDDATPWVTRDGKLLLLRALPPGADCTPVDGDATDLYVALLDTATGLPRATAVALSGVNASVDQSTETDPSFSDDLCTLYFASDGGAAGGTRFSAVSGLAALSREEPARDRMTIEMQYTTLGRTGLKVSRLCLGTMNFGPETSEADAFRIMDRALELGINFFDTANVYGWKKGEGITEQIVGRWLAQGGGRRERIVLATKVYGEMGVAPNQGRLSAFHIRRACDESLRRLQTDVIDLYQMHHVDRATPWEEIWQAMDVLVSQGKIIYVGSSNFAGWHIAQASEVARSRHGLGLVSEQCKYNLLTRLVETEIQPACERYGIGLMPYSPIGGGLLAGSGRRGDATKIRRESDFAKREREKHGSSIEKFVALAAALGQEPADIALSWVLSRPAVAAPIVGPRTLEHLESCLGALAIRLESDTLEKIDAIFPGYRPSPESFAW